MLSWHSSLSCAYSPSIPYGCQFQAHLLLLQSSFLQRCLERQHKIAQVVVFLQSILISTFAINRCYSHLGSELSAAEFLLQGFFLFVLGLSLFVTFPFI